MWVFRNEYFESLRVLRAGLGYPLGPRQGYGRPPAGLG